ncbi:MAG TPA: DUF308 domain-containing protein [Candidatus Saccharimonadales bacterium]|nr:DUF308 domain-containing protein [Candidatus Saccharimonadales bacterium]
MATQVDAKRVSSALALRGIVAILFGIAAVFWPGITLVTLVYLFSGFVLASGLVTLVMGLIDASRERNSVLSLVLTVALGIVEIGVGVYLLRHVGVAFNTLILLIGFVLIFRGLVELFNGLFEDDTSGMYRTASSLTGALAVIAGVILLFQPESGGVAFVWILGLYALLAGPLMVALALDINKG